MAKPFGVRHATAVLEKYRERAPDGYTERREMIGILRRLPVDVDDELVLAALVRDMTESSVDGSQATCLLTAIPARGIPPNPKRWARVVVRAMQRFERDPHAAFYLAALPADANAWEEHMTRLDSIHGSLPGLWNSKRWTHEQRERFLRRIVADPAVVAGARAAARLASPSMYDGWWWILAADGGAESVPLVEAFVEDAAKSADALDWLARAYAPLMISKKTAAIRAKLVANVETRHAPGIEAARVIGVKADALRFKVGLYASGGMPRIRMWIDSTRNPWFDARWNWDELVTNPKTPKHASPIDALRGFLRSCVADGKGEFRTWELATAHRGADKDKLVAFLSAELKGLTGPTPASAPLKAFKG